VAALAAIAAACGTDYYEIPIETPIMPKLDVTPFQRVLVIGFVAGGTEDVDANQETVRLLRSQLRTKSSLRVIDADSCRSSTSRAIKAARARTARAPTTRRRARAARRRRD